MPQFQELYYIEKHEAVQYSSFSGGSFDVGEFSKGRPFWKRTKSVADIKPKSLLLTDWSAFNWPYSKIAALQRQLQHLLDDGFSLFVWQDDQVVKLDKNSLSRLNDKGFRARIVPAFPDDILDCAIRQHKLNRDHIQLIDDYWLDYLLQDGVFPAQRALDISAWVESPRHYELWQLVNNAQPPYALFVRTTANHDDMENKRLVSLQDAFPNIPFICVFKRNKDDASPLLKRNRQYAFVDMEAILIEDLADDSEHAQTPGHAFPNLNALELYGVVLNKLSGLQLPDGSWPDLKSLKIHLRNNISWKAFTQAFLEHFPNLNYLNLLSDSKTAIEFTADSSLSRLEHLHIDDGLLVWNSLKHLPKLQHLNVRVSTPMSGLTEALFLPHLISVTLDGSDTLNQQIMSRLFAANPLLEELDFSSRLTLAPGFTRGLNISKLTRLSCSSSNFPEEDLAYLLSRPLKKLHLSGCQTLTPGFTSGKDFSQLQSLNVQNSNISMADLSRILQQANTLRDLDLNGLTIPKNFFQFIALSHLRSLHLTGTNLDQDDLSAILIQTKQLRYLNLTQYKNFRPNVSLRHDLPRLEELSLTSSNISFSDFESLLSKAPLLSKLSFASAPHLISNPRIAQLTARIPLARWKRIVASQRGAPALQAQHQTDEFRRFKPTHDDKLFVFKGENQSKNQAMIVEKLSQYLTLKGEHLDLIPKIQDGICTAVSYLFLNTGHSEWAVVLTHLQRWDGKIDSLINDQTLQDCLQRVRDFVLRYQLSPRKINTFVGDSLDAFAATQTSNMVFVNPWHAIAVKRLGTDHWLMHDPEFTNGPVRCHNNELKAQVQRQLGLLVAVDSDRPWQAALRDSASFIGEGGLLTLMQCHNRADLLAQLNPADVTPDALSGLLLRDLKGKPAWMQGLAFDDIAHLTLRLLAAFVEHHPRHYKSLLQDSLEVVSAYNQYELIANLRKRRDDAPGLVERLCRLLRKNPGARPLWEQSLRGLRQHSPTFDSPLAYCQHLLQGEGKKQVIDLSSSVNAQALSLHLQSYCHDTGRPYFYVDAYSDLDCFSDYIRHDGQRGTLVPGPGGPLHAYLLACQSQGHKPVFIVNCDLFDTHDIKSFIALLDANSTFLPTSSTLIALTNPDKPGAYQGEDFYPAFDEREPCPLSTQALTSSLPALPEEADAAAIVINLYHAPDWKERLLGRWIMQDNDFFFQEGQLTAALRTGLPINIHNGLWDDPAFISFWQKARTPLPIRHEGFIVQLPPDAVFHRSKGYDWQALMANVRFEYGLVNEALPLNPGLLGACFLRWHCDNEQRSLTALPGFIEQQAPGSEWLVNITRSLSKDEWAMLLDACQQRSLRPCFHLAAGVELPPSLAHNLPSTSSSEALTRQWHGQREADTLVIHSQDLDSSVQLLTQDGAGWMILDISECSPDDLLLHLDSEYQPDSARRYRFHEEERVLLKALREGRRVLLKGEFPADLIDALTPLLLARQQSSSNKGQLVLISEDASQLAFAKPMLHVVDKKLKESALRRRGYSRAEIQALSKQQRSDEALSRLITRLDFLRAHPGQSSDDAWKGMDGLSPRIVLDAFDADNSQRKAQAFIDERVRNIHNIWRRSPYVFLTGLTATGKTTLVENDLVQPGDTLYRGEAEMEAWASDHHTPGRKILFIDEANLSPRQWSEMEGLFNNPPSILINGRYYPLSDQHKVVFAGNPLNYGGGRRLAPFFQRHGQALVFDPMPLEFIFEKILKPVFDNSILEQDALGITQPFLEVYRYLCERSTTEVLISPRELQMMALLTLSAAERNPGIDPRALARFYAYQLAKSLVPEDCLSDFSDRFAASYPIAGNSNQDAPGDFLMPDSRKDCSLLIDDLLALRQRRQTQPGNDAQQYGGLGGIIVEGSPSSEHIRFILQKLQAHGDFYHLTASMSQDQKKKLALKAWREGAIVFNNGPMDERFLNDLAMGKNPESSDGKRLRADKPGFVFISTQDPAGMTHRVKPGNAVARRFIAANLKDYTTQELRAILINDGLLAEDAKVMVDVYQQQQIMARQQASQAPPTLAALKRVARDCVTSPGYGAARLEHDTLSTDERASLFIEEELHRLRQARKTMHNSGAGLINTPIIHAIEALQRLLDQHPDDKAAMLKDWYHAHEPALKQPSGPNNTFFTVNQRTSTRQLISTLCDYYHINETDLETAVPPPGNAADPG